MAARLPPTSPIPSTVRASPIRMCCAVSAPAAPERPWRAAAMRQCSSFVLAIRGIMDLTAHNPPDDDSDRQAGASATPPDSSGNKPHVLEEVHGQKGKPVISQRGRRRGPSDRALTRPDLPHDWGHFSGEAEPLNEAPDAVEAHS